MLFFFAAAAALAVASPLTRRSISNGPVIKQNFADPSLNTFDGVWYSFATRTKGTTVNVQAASSKDFVTWTVATNADGSQKDAMPQIPAWVNPTTPAVWAPAVARISTNKFVLYFSALLNSSLDPSGRFHCVGYATATSVQGPYTAASSPLICPLSDGGAIDQQQYKDTDGKRWLVYKVDGNSLGNGGACGNTVAPLRSTPIKLQRLADDGFTLIGNPTTILDHSGLADDGIVEAPSLTRAPSGKYILFFSTGCFTTDHYTVSYATADNIAGPYTRQSTPLLKTGSFGLSGPGGAAVSADASHIIFHANMNDPTRLLREPYTGILTVNGNKVSI